MAETRGEPIGKRILGVLVMAYVLSVPFMLGLEKERGYREGIRVGISQGYSEGMNAGQEIAREQQRLACKPERLRELTGL
ncbi:MAG: hypothetical protein KKF56_01215 [Nanoarchaeota archaeon]|nr:hypothetical protein [Nanoarchaeota archaeon]